jgi:hypothetical protein|uniref:KTSC domain n=1 Tax=Myoviridae sp. ctshb19 TaxID=2825194 RepID=A0A8S5UFW9_9CAUD|nr:MAG TPA: KTSC domain [Myoviridae sp. ctshb19]
MSKLDLTKYKWFQYSEDAIELTFDQDRHNVDYVLELHPGNVFGVMKRAYGIYVVHAHSPDIQFSLNQAELTRIMQHSKGWSGKVARVAVKAGVGGLDGPQEEMPPGWFKIEDLNSSNLNHAIYDSKRKTLYVAFHRGDSWAYENVSMKEYKEMVAAESRGRYFIYRIKYVKSQYKLGMNFDKPPYDTTPVGEVIPPPPAPASHATAPEAKGVKYPKQPAAETKPAKAPKAPKAKAFEIPEGMKVNGRAKISITHSAHPGKTANKTWSGVGFEWLGAKHPELGRILGDLATTGKAEVDDGKGMAYLTLKDNILIPVEGEAEKPAEKAPAEEKPGKAKRDVHIPKSAYDNWMDTEQNNYEREHKPAGHAFEILRRQRVDSEGDIFKLMASLRYSTLVRHDQRAYKMAASSIISMADQYPFTLRGKKTYQELRKHVIAIGHTAMPPMPSAEPAAPAQAPVKFKIPKGAFDVWMDSEQGSFEDHHVGDKEPTDHVYAILRRQRVDSEQEVFKLLKSLTKSSLVAYNKRAFNTAAKAILAMGDEYKFSTAGEALYKRERAAILDMVKRPASDFD